MKVVITGNMGYVGPVLSQHLRATHEDLTLIGFDTGFFGHCTTGSQVLPEVRMDMQVLGDVRNFPQHLLKGADAVVHLAAVSNDPMGQRFEQVTEDINYRASRRIAEMARDAGVSRFVFASSCSMYGAAEGAPKRETDELNPLTAYARSKVAVEQALADMDLGDMVATALRFATACGASDRLRLDLVLNDFVASALASGHIEVLSDGTPWRPLIEVRDMARAIDWGITRETDAGGQFLQINAGSDEWNYQVKDLAAAVQAAVPGTSLSINTEAAPDKRSYRVDFRLFQELAPEHQPRISLEAAIDGLRTRLTAMSFSDSAFRQSPLIRLTVLESLQAAGQLDGALHWIRRS